MPNLKPKPKIKLIPFNKSWILFEDEDLIIVNKPSGLLSVPGRKANPAASLIGQVTIYCNSALIVHRLDMDTSGIMLLAKNKKAHKNLSKQFQDRVIKKQYQAICFGIASQQQGCINLPMRCDWEYRPLQIIDFKQGKNACTYWQLIEQQNNFFKVLLTPITGRSHQLRLHMQQIGHPILGDNLYAEYINQPTRLLLHASALTFLHPCSNENIEIELNSCFWHV